LQPRQNIEFTDHDITGRKGIRKTNFLSDIHIDAAYVLLRNLRDSIGGMYNCRFGEEAKFPKAEGDKWMQIIHNGSNHWILATKGFFKEKKQVPLQTVEVFDSCANKELTNNFSTCSIASLLRTEDESFYIDYLNCQQQKNDYDCGVFAIAFATCLLMGQNPLKKTFRQSELRAHLKKCLIDRELTMFPNDDAKFPTVSVLRNEYVEVHCYCRRPAFRNRTRKLEKMLVCKACSYQFHPTCENDKICFDKKGNFTCSMCLQKQNKEDREKKELLKNIGKKIVFDDSD